MSTELVGLDLAPRPTDTLADKVRRAGQARALVAFAKKVQDHADADLRRDVDAVTDATGEGGFSKKVDGVNATLTDPQPKPRITDADEFKTWWVGEGLDHVEREYVEVVDHAAVASTLLAWNRGDPLVCDAGSPIASALEVRLEIILPANALESLTESGRCVATDDGLVEVKSGELVPGVSCFRAEQVLRVTPDKHAKKRDAAIVESFFGLPAALEGGQA